MRNTISAVAIALLLVISANGCGSDGAKALRNGDVLVPDELGVLVDGDNVSGTGTVNFFNLEGGFWAIRGDNNRVYDPLNSLAEEFRQENLRVRFAGRIRRDMASIHMVGEIIQITSIERR